MEAAAASDRCFAVVVAKREPVLPCSAVHGAAAPDRHPRGVVGSTQDGCAA